MVLEQASITFSMCHSSIEIPAIHGRIIRFLLEIVVIFGDRDIRNIARLNLS